MKTNNFVAIDFEMSYGHIPCSIGIVEFIDGDVFSEYYSLIKPIELKFHYKNIEINGIRLKDVENEREFNEIWSEIKHYFENKNIMRKAIVILTLLTILIILSCNSLLLALIITVFS